MIPRDRSDGRHFLALYTFSDQPYVPSLHWNTNRGWAQDPLYVAPKTVYDSDPTPESQPFILDTTLNPQ